MSAPEPDARPPNILFIMCDQLRWDYLGCYGHPSLKTPNIDALAARGLRFTRAYSQSTVCGPARMSFYTGRYMRNHGSTWNDVPLRADETTLGDHLAAAGMRTVLVGKTHHRPDLEGMKRLGVDPAGPEGRRIGQGGFEVFVREEGVCPQPPGEAPRTFDSPYTRYLKSKGYDDSANPWSDWANAAEDAAGAPASGWFLDNAERPARVAEADSETAWLTDQAVEAMDALGDAPWCLHLSYIKPHWPYIAPAPYHALYGPDQRLAAVGAEAEPRHPVFKAFGDMRVSQAFRDPAIRSGVVGAYMGLIAQIDAHIGRLTAALEARGLSERTLIVFTSDHGDYLGDHGLGEKDFMHECSVRIPLIIADPRPQADAARGEVCERLVEAIDLIPTFMEHAGLDPAHPRLDGRSLRPLIEGRAPDDWRRTAFSEYDFALLPVRRAVGAAMDEAGMTAVIEDRWKMIWFPRHRPMLFDLMADPQELNDLGEAPDLAPVRAELEQRLLAWALRIQRPTESDASLARRTQTQLSRGILLGLKTAAELEPALAAEAAARGST